MLERLYADNYRCLVNFECRFGPAQLVLGANGAGKSTVFDLICTLRDFCAGGAAAEPLFMGGTRTRWQNVSVQTFEMDVSGNGGDYSLKLVLDEWGSPARPRVVKEELLFSGKPIFRFADGEVHLFNDRHEEKVAYPFDWHRSALATVTERVENTKLTWFKRWLSNVMYFSPDPRQMRLSGGLADKESAAPAMNLGNFAGWYRHLRLESGDQPLMTDLQQVIPGFDRMDLKDAGMGNRILVLSFFSNGDGPRYIQLFGEVSDGQRVLIGLYTILRFALKPNTTLLFDEPDNFVALKEISPWLEGVLDLAEDEESNTQVLLISHHPELLNRMAFQSGLSLDRPEGRHTRVASFADEAETGLSPAELVSRGWDNV